MNLKNKITTYSVLGLMAFASYGCYSKLEKETPKNIATIDSLTYCLSYDLDSLRKTISEYSGMGKLDINYQTKLRTITRNLENTSNKIDSLVRNANPDLEKDTWIGRGIGVFLVLGFSYSMKMRNK